MKEMENFIMGPLKNLQSIKQSARLCPASIKSVHAI